jgi:hypothetical protein
MKYLVLILILVSLFPAKARAQCAVDETEVHSLFFNTLNLWNPNAFTNSEFKDPCDPTKVTKAGINTASIALNLGKFGIALFLALFMLEATRRMFSTEGLHFTNAIRLYATSAIVAVILSMTLIGNSGDAIYVGFIETIFMKPIAAISQMLTSNSSAEVKERFVDAYAAYSKANQDSESFWSFIPFIDLNIGLFFANALVLLALMIAWAISIYVSLMCTVVLCLGPLFLPFLVFQPLSQIGWNWIRAMIAYPMMCLVGSATTAMIMRTELLKFTVSTGEDANYISSITASITLILVSLMVPSLTNSIVGGVAGSPRSAGRQLKGAGESGLGMGGSAAGLGAAAGAMAGGSAVFVLAGSAAAVTGNKGLKDLASQGGAFARTGFGAAGEVVKQDMKRSLDRVTSLGRAIAPKGSQKAQG